MFAPTVSTTQNRRLGQTARADMESAPTVQGGDACIGPAGVRQTGAWGKALSPTRCGGSPLAEGAKKNTAAHYRSYSTPLSLSYSTVQPSACKRAAVGVSAAVRT